MACKKSRHNYSIVSDAASWYCGFVFVLLMLLSSFRESFEDVSGSLQVMNRPCDEIYVVGDGETLHSISDKCGDPFILEENPHIQDPDDVFPGLIIKITRTAPDSLSAKFFMMR